MKKLLFLFLIFNIKLYSLLPFDLSKKPPVKDGVHKIPNINYLRSLGYSQKEIEKAIGTIGTKKLAVIFVNFNGADATTSSSPVMTATDLDNANVYLSRFKDFYWEASYQKLEIIISTFGPYNLIIYHSLCNIMAIRKIHKSY